MNVQNYKRVVALSLMLVLAACSGCSESGPALVPVDGVVLLDGEPLGTGTVTTTLEEGSGARGQIRGDGSFSLETRGLGKGTVPGTHRIAVLAYESADPGNPEARRKLLIPAKYTNVFNSGLELEVPAEGKRDLKIELTTN